VSKKTRNMRHIAKLSEIDRVYPNAMIRSAIV